MLGCVAAVIETESPSQLSPAVRATARRPRRPSVRAAPGAPGCRSFCSRDSSRRQQTGRRLWRQRRQVTRPPRSAHRCAATAGKTRTWQSRGRVVNVATGSFVPERWPASERFYRPTPGLRVARAATASTGDDARSALRQSPHDLRRPARHHRPHGRGGARRQRADDGGRADRGEERARCARWRGACARARRRCSAVECRRPRRRRAPPASPARCVDRLKLTRARSSRPSPRAASRSPRCPTRSARSPSCGSRPSGIGVGRMRVPLGVFGDDLREPAERDHRGRVAGDQERQRLHPARRLGGDPFQPGAVAAGPGRARRGRPAARRGAAGPDHRPRRRRPR